MISLQNKENFLSKEGLLAMNHNWGLAFNLEQSVIEIIHKINKCQNTVQRLFPKIIKVLLLMINTKDNLKIL